jgi:DNA repair protein RecN (Recombination protein N)
VAVRKDDSGKVTTAQASVLDDDERVVELSRMLSGSPDSETARQHATELLASVRPPRSRTSEGS